MSNFLLFIIAANVLISFKGFNDLPFFGKYLFDVRSVKAGDQIRMISSGFLHVNVTHLFLNMFTLYFFAPTVIENLGDFYFLVLYFGSLIAGNLLSLMIHKDEPHYTAVGASGAVTGILYAAILLQPNASIYIMFIPIGIPTYVFGVAYLLYSIYGMRIRRDNIGHAAHFGGAIGGYGMCLMMDPQVFVENTLMVILLAIPILILFVLLKMGKF